MASRQKRIELLEDGHFVLDVTVALCEALGCSPKKLQDVLNGEDGPSRIEQAHSLLERLSAVATPTAELIQALENILFGSSGQDSESEEDFSDDDSEADDEGEEDDEGEQDEEDEEGEEEDERAAGEDLVAAAPQQDTEMDEEDAGLAPASQGSQDSVLDYRRDSGEETEFPDEELLNYEDDAHREPATHTAHPEQDDELAKGEDMTEGEEETDMEEHDVEKDDLGELEDEDTQAEASSSQEETQEKPVPDEATGNTASSGGTGGEAGRKRKDSPPPDGWPSQSGLPVPKRPRHCISTSSSTSTVDKEAAGEVLSEAEEAAEGMLEAAPPEAAAEDNQAVGARDDVNAMVLHQEQGRMPLALIGVDSSAGDDGMSPVAMQRRLSDLEDTMQRVQQQQQVQRMQLRVLFHPEQLVAFANQAAVAIGVSNTRYGSGIILTAQGHISTAHHVLLDCGWNEDSPSLVQVGREAKIVWSHEAEVLSFSPSPRPPAQGMPNHRQGRPRPWLDLALLKVRPLPDSPFPHLPVWLGPLEEGMPIMVLGYGQQTVTDTRATLFGTVACPARYDRNIGCKVFDIGGNMLSGHSGGMVVHRLYGCVLGYCVTSQSEPNPGEFVGKMQTPHGHFDIKGKLKVNNACGGLHTVVPIAELQSLLGTSLAP